MVLLERLFEERVEFVVVFWVQSVTAHAGVRVHESTRTASQKSDLLLFGQSVEVGLVEGLSHAIVGVFCLYFQNSSYVFLQLVSTNHNTSGFRVSI